MGVGLGGGWGVGLGIGYRSLGMSQGLSLAIFADTINNTSTCTMSYKHAGFTYHG